MPQDSVKYVDTRGAARHLGLSVSYLQTARVTGNGPPYIKATPKRVLYAIEDLDAWMMARRVRSTSEYPSREADADACALATA